MLVTASCGASVPVPKLREPAATVRLVSKELLLPLSAQELVPPELSTTSATLPGAGDWRLSARTPLVP